MDANVKQTILRAGIAAPSADNSQPWRFRWDDDTLDLGIDPARAGGVSDARYVLSDLATGACAENMLVSGRALGFDADLQFFPTDDDLWPLRLTWSPSPTCGEPLAEAIATRHTDRRFPWRGTVTAGARSRLNEQAQRYHARLHWLNDKDRRRQALRILHRAEALRFQSPRLHAELFSSIRFDLGWRATAAEGLPPAALAVEAPARPLFQALRNPRLMAAVNHVRAPTLLGFRSAVLPARLSPDLCLLSTSATARPDIISVGRALERVWLQATHEGLAVQPFAAAGVLTLNFLSLEPELTPVIGRLRDAMHRLSPNDHGLLFLRLGRARSPLQRQSGRRELRSFPRT